MEYFGLPPSSGENLNYKFDLPISPARIRASLEFDSISPNLLAKSRRLVEWKIKMILIQI